MPIVRPKDSRLLHFSNQFLCKLQHFTLPTVPSDSYCKSTWWPQLHTDCHAISLHLQCHHTWCQMYHEALSSCLLRLKTGSASIDFLWQFQWLWHSETARCASNSWPVIKKLAANTSWCFRLRATECSVMMNWNPRPCFASSIIVIIPCGNDESDRSSSSATSLSETTPNNDHGRIATSTLL